MRILNGDAREMLSMLPDSSVQCVVTSPPYYGLRDYNVPGQIGLESTVDDYVSALVETFREVRRVLADDGTLWLNLGDSYAGGGCGARDPELWPKQSRNDHMATHAKRRPSEHIKPKDLIGIPWRMAFALQADGWYLRQDIIWSKPNPMPESVKDRCTKSHEYLFLLTKSPRYFYEAAAIAEETAWELNKSKMPDGWDTGPGGHGSFHRDGREKGASWKGSHFDKGKTAEHQLNRMQQGPRFGGSKYGDDGSEDSRTKSGNEYQGNGKRNKRSVWTIATQPYKEAHFATFPEKLVEPCILAGSRPGDTVLDPFMGSGTTLAVAKRFGRRGIGIELNPEYIALAQARLDKLPIHLPLEMFA